MATNINMLFDNLVTIGTTVGVSVAAFYLMLGAFLYMTANGSPHQMERGKTAMTCALLGLAVVFMARTMVNALHAALGA